MEVCVKDSCCAHLPSMRPSSARGGRASSKTARRGGKLASLLLAVALVPPPPRESQGRLGLLRSLYVLAPARGLASHAARPPRKLPCRALCGLQWIAGQCRPSPLSTSRKNKPMRQACNVSQMASSCAAAYPRDSDAGGVRSAWLAGRGAHGEEESCTGTAI